MSTKEDLFKKYISGEVTAKEKAIVETWYLKYQTNPSDLTQEQLIKAQEESLLLLNQSISKTVRLKRFKFIAAAASILLFIGVGAYVFKLDNIGDQKQKQLSSSNNVSRNIAILTLNNGKKIELTDQVQGEIVNEEGIKIEKTEDGQLIYSLSDVAKKQGDVSAFNTIETPARSQFQINLPDGSTVWLNASSKLRYPISFSDNERRVELNGEAYFEIAHRYKKGDLGNEKLPFVVRAGNQLVKVLGTHFNINAYHDEETIKTSLLEGAVSVTLIDGKLNHHNEILLKPGQMAVNDLNASHLKLASFDKNDVIAWKNGYFIFNNENIKDIMKKLSHWYGFEVEYRGDMTDVEFQGNYLRSRALWNLLKTIEVTNKVTFKQEGSRIVVSRNAN